MSHTLYESPWSEACYSEPRFSRLSSRAIRRKIKTALPRYGRILMIYLKGTEMSHAFWCIYYDLFEVTWGQTFAKTVKLRLNRTGQSRYIDYIYVAIQNFVKNLIKNYLRSNQVMKSRKRSNLGEIRVKSGRNTFNIHMSRLRIVWRIQIQYYLWSNQVIESRCRSNLGQNGPKWSNNDQIGSIRFDTKFGLEFQLRWYEVNSDH